MKGGLTMTQYLLISILLSQYPEYPSLSLSIMVLDKVVILLNVVFSNIINIRLPIFLCYQFLVFISLIYQHLGQKILDFSPLADIFIGLYLLIIIIKTLHNIFFVISNITFFRKRTKGLNVIKENEVVINSKKLNKNDEKNLKNPVKKFQKLKFENEQAKKPKMNQNDSNILNNFQLNDSKVVEKKKKKRKQNLKGRKQEVRHFSQNQFKKSNVRQKMLKKGKQSKFLKVEDSKEIKKDKVMRQIMRE